MLLPTPDLGSLGHLVVFQDYPHQVVKHWRKLPMFHHLAGTCKCCLLAPLGIHMIRCGEKIFESDNQEINRSLHGWDSSSNQHTVIFAGVEDRDKTTTPLAPLTTTATTQYL